MIKGDIANLSADQKDTIDVVLKDYGDMEPFELREFSHSEKPWSDVHGNLPDDAVCSKVISKDSMGFYYGSL